MMIAASFVGGVGLFLLGMHLMTDGLKVAAGARLRDMLAKGTKTRLTALFSGALVTGVVQSSSAVTLATIGFVNAGLLELRSAVWVIFGSNVGTTMTGWVVALTGLEIDLDPLALPAIGIGMLLRLTGANHRRGAIGEALAGFGLFFLGIGVLYDAFSGIAEAVDVEALRFGGVLGALAFIGLGAVLTVATQSSSASLALALTAASSGVLDLSSAGAMVVGANLGTTPKAWLASLGATPNARRTAWAHVVFNVAAGVVALMLLPWILDLLVLLMGDAPIATLLALFHTVFNVLGVIVMWPLADPLLRFLEKRFRTKEEDAGRPVHLDPTVLSVPTVALEALRLEAGRLGHLAADMLARAVGPRPLERATLDRQKMAFEQLVAAVSDYLRRLDRSTMSAEVAAGVQALVRAVQHWVIAAEQAHIVLHLRAEGEASERASTTLPRYFESVRDVATAADPSLSAASRGTGPADTATVAEAEQRFGRLEERRDQSEQELVRQVVAGARDPASVLWRQHLMAEARRGAKHLVRALERLSERP